ncbi:MAG: hypothetical protein IKB08_00300 [Clostridia bacterium]|nr:hypothetical protein [Clostridia bacterium]
MAIGYNSDKKRKIGAQLITPDKVISEANGNIKTDSPVVNAGMKVASTAVPAVKNAGNKNIYDVSDAYQAQADAIYKKIQETPDFKYDFNEDAVFKALQEQYMKSGKLAAENVAGQAAALSGGYGNSYGATAAGQAYMGAIDDLYDVIPELSDRAYSRYQNERAEALQNWEIMQNRADKERAYAEAERDYNDSRDAYLWEIALQKAELGDYGALKELGVDTSGSEYDRKLSDALMRAELGDYSALKELGIDTSGSEYDRKLSDALTRAELGDYSGLEALGIDVSGAQKKEKLDFALIAAELGDYSDLKELGIDVTGKMYEEAFNKALQKAQLGDYSGLKALGVDVSTVQKQNELDFALAAAELGDYSFLKALGINTSALEAPKYTYSSSGSSSSGGSGQSGKVDNSNNSIEDEATLKRKKEYQTEIERLQRIIANPNLYGAAISGDAGKKLKQLEEAYRKEFSE